MSEYPKLEHIREKMHENGMVHIFETVRVVGGENVARLHDAKLSRLFAAAPMMLEALEAVAAFLHWLDQEQGIHLAGDMLHGNILEAIKAAKGEV